LAQQPAKAVIDPDLLLVDRRPEDNTRAAIALGSAAL